MIRTMHVGSLSRPADVSELIFAVERGTAIDAARFDRVVAQAVDDAVAALATIPNDKVLIPGVIDSTTNFIEHTKVVSNRIESFVTLVGADRVIAGTDCGSSTFAGFGAVDPDIVYAKLATLAEGAALVRA